MIQNKEDLFDLINTQKVYKGLHYQMHANQNKTNKGDN